MLKYQINLGLHSMNSSRILLIMHLHAFISTNIRNKTIVLLIKTNSKPKSRQRARLTKNYTNYVAAKG